VPAPTPPRDNPLGTPPPPTRRSRGRANAGPSTAARLVIPPGHLPDPGECAVGFRNASPATARSRSRGPARHKNPRPSPPPRRPSWIIYRPSDNKKVVHVRRSMRAPGHVVRIRIFDIETSRLRRRRTLHEAGSRRTLIITVGCGPKRPPPSFAPDPDSSSKSADPDSNEHERLPRGVVRRGLHRPLERRVARSLSRRATTRTIRRGCNVVFLRARARKATRSKAAAGAPTAIRSPQP